MTGALMAIGGAIDLKRPTLVQEFYHRAGGSQARLIILPTASSLPDSGVELREALIKEGLHQPPLILPVRSRAAAQDPALVDPIRAASGVFFTGGNQARLSSWLGGTLLESELHAAYQAGALIAGSSAGAAALSAVMIAFGRGGATPRQRSAQFAPGLGFTDQVIFDQHFRQRDRLGRLLYAVALHPGMLGVGVDENTAAILQGHSLEICGQNAVTIVDGRPIQDTDVADVSGASPVAVSGARLHVLTHGCAFDLASRQAQIPPKTLKVS
jgi:cyanophycinase